MDVPLWRLGLYPGAHTVAVWLSASSMAMDSLYCTTLDQDSRSEGCDAGLAGQRRATGAWMQQNSGTGDGMLTVAHDIQKTAAQTRSSSFFLDVVNCAPAECCHQPRLVALVATKQKQGGPLGGKQYGRIVTGEIVVSQGALAVACVGHSERNLRRSRFKGSMDARVHPPGASIVAARECLAGN